MYYLKHKITETAEVKTEIEVIDNSFDFECGSVHGTYEEPVLINGATEMTLHKKLFTAYEWNAIIEDLEICEYENFLDLIAENECQEGEIISQLIGSEITDNAIVLTHNYTCE